MYEIPRFLSGDFFIEKFMCQYDQSNIIMAKKIPATIIVAGNQVSRNFCSPYEIRTRITTVKGWCPSP
jgi:hypothetical protein